ncbi:MAG TPA: methyltransferase [Blastocatellia bacterium]|nr:methyltransferase [Blastocatellia bacterium]
MIEHIIPWLAFITLEAAFALGCLRFVPEATREAYAASCRNLSVICVALVAHSIWVVALIQNLITPAQVTKPQILIGLLIAAAGQTLVVLAMRSNPYFVATVTMPPRLIVDGPYRIFRHPGYSGMALHAVGLVILLGQSWALLPAVIYIALLVRQSIIEDRLLRVFGASIKTGFDIQHLQPKDFPLVAEWEHGAIAEADWTQYIAEMSNPRWIRLGLHLDGQIVGCVSFEKMSCDVARVHIATRRRAFHPSYLAYLLREIAKVVLEDVKTIEAIVPDDKRAVAKLAVRVGMRREDVLPWQKRFVLTREDVHDA